MIKRALISVSDKTNIAAVAQRLAAKSIEIVSTGGTAALLQEAGISVVPVEDLTQFPECFGGRVKTMHPAITGGVLFRRDHAQDVEHAEQFSIPAIDLVIVNLYPFEQALQEGRAGDNASITDVPSDGIDEMIELIDIGGPTLLRSAAKNCAHVTVVTDPADYDRVLTQIETSGDTTLALRRELATNVFLRTAAYDAAITDYLSGGKNRGVMLTNGQSLRYGENPHQWGAFFEQRGVPAGWTVLQEEKQMSYLNILDADGAANLVAEFEQPAAACIKHANPSGVAVHDDISEAFQRSYDADRLSAFGVIVALNRPCPASVVQKIIDQKIFTEVLIAPSFEPDAIALLKEKPKIRAIEYVPQHTSKPVVRSMLGGYLLQDTDHAQLRESDLTCVTDEEPTPDQVRDLLFAWRVVKYAKSNAIVFAKDAVTVGIGCGQTSRVDSTIIAARRAGERSQGAVMASDAFFPFADSVEEAAKHGIAAMIQPGGSVRDEEVFAKANELGIAMITTGTRAFRH